MHISPKDEVLVEEIRGTIILLPQPKSFTEFMLGLGEEVWEGMDPKVHVGKERADWK